MAKRKAWTEAQKQAARDRYAARQNKNPNQNEKEVQPAPVVMSEPAHKETIQSEVDIVDLQRQIDELKSNQFLDIIKALRGETETNGNASVAGGRLTGTFEKYAMAADLYPSPVERLKVEPKLQRFAFPINYDLIYEIGSSEYETIDGIRTREPKFMLTLVHIMMDEDTGLPTNGRYEICRFVMHEDPSAALVIARDNNLEVEAEDETTFLNEMRYIRMRDWVLECFYPSPVKKEHNKREVVVSGKLVTYYEVNNEEGKGLSKNDWDNVPKIKF